MWREPEKISRCRSCDQFFWVEDAEVLGQLDDSPFQSEDLQVIPADSIPPDRDLPVLQPSELLEALEVGVASGEDQERYLRQLVWWRANHPVRESVKEEVPHEPAGHSQSVQASLTAMLEQLDPENPQDRLARAEALRELRRFPEAIEVLEASFDDENHQRVADIIRRLASEEVWEVRPLYQDE